MINDFKKHISNLFNKKKNIKIECRIEEMSAPKRMIISEGFYPFNIKWNVIEDNKMNFELCNRLMSYYDGKRDTYNMDGIEIIDHVKIEKLPNDFVRHLVDLGFKNTYSHTEVEGDFKTNIYTKENSSYEEALEIVKRIGEKRIKSFRDFYKE